MTNLKSKVMTRAWRIFKNETMRWRFPTFADALRQAWAAEKSYIERDKEKAAAQEAQAAKLAEMQALEARMAEAEKLAANHPRVIEIDKLIFMLKMKDVWNSEDWAYSRKLYAERDALVAQLAA